MKIDEVRSLASDDLFKKEVELREEYQKLIFKNRIRPLEDSSKLRKIKKDIARLLTVKNQRLDTLES